MRFRRLLPLVFLVAGALAPRAGAQVPGQVTPGTEGVGLDQKLGAKLPLGLAFRDDAGQDVTLGRYFGQGKPVVLMLVYYNCPMLCNLLLDGVTQSFRGLPRTPGADFTVVTVSFEPTETTAQAARQKAKHVQDLGRPAAAEGWHFLTGSKPNILRLADAVGFRYRWDAANAQYAHPATLLFVAPDGTITRYLPGLTFPPLDVRLALNEAAEGKVGSVVDAFLMFCYQYDPNKGGYGLVALRVMQLGGLVTLLVLGAFLTVLWRRHHTASPLPLA